MGGNNHSNKKKYKPNSVNSLVTHKKYITVSHIADKNNFNKKQINKIIKNTINSSTSREDDDNRLYCICKKPSEGRMIACDNQNCKIEWFHYKCVKISRAPRTQWFCSKKCKDEYKSKKK
ncbi:uncharacterized protein SCDLUD_003149 [Saccharomycodes ludwigii]|nr:hypothetical protein SCDLUD_003149 [Saccharomycodes ludwigii]KAH3900178.1 hypothetical protein SCDLUD_003149 [Saccharomycodes ludwigii]